jgi:hypothetical protein
MRQNTELVEMGRKKKIDRAKLKKLIKRGLSDYKIAKILKCSYETIKHIRTEELGIYKERGGRLNQIIKYAKEILPKCKTRVELVRKTAKHFKLNPKTIDSYLAVMGFKTGRMGLKEYWRKVRKGELDEPEHMQPTKTLKFIADIFSEPKFSFELNYPAPEFYRRCVNAKIPVRRCVFYVKRDEKLKNVPVGRVIIYFFPFQKELAYRKILNYYQLTDRRLIFLKRVFGCFGGAQNENRIE